MKPEITILAKPMSRIEQNHNLKKSDKKLI